MGLFKSKKKTKVGTTVSRVIADDALPSAVKTGLTKALFEDGEIVDYVMEEMVASVGVRAERMYAYAKNHYSYGLPSGKFHSEISGKDVVTNVIRDIVGLTAVIDYYHYGPLNNLHVGWQALVTSHGYVAATNTLTALSTEKGVPVYLKDMVVVVTEATLEELSDGSLDNWGNPPTAGYTPERPAQTTDIGNLRQHSPFVVDPLAVTDSVRVDYVWSTANQINEASFSIPLTGYDEESDYFQVKYTLNGVVGYWLYEAGSGAYPEIDALFSDEFDNLGSFFPFGYFRYNKTSMAALPESTEYKTSRKMLKYLGMDYAAVIDAVHENPGIADVEQAMVIMAVPAVTSNALEQRYLFDFFYRAYYATGGEDSVKNLSAYRIKTSLAGVFGQRPADSGIIIQDARFKMALSFKGIFKKRKVGVLGTNGLLLSGQSVEPITQTGVHAVTQEPVTWTVNAPFHYYRRQVSDVLYDEVQVFGLKMTYHIYGKYNTVGDEADTILLIPLDRSITSDYSIPDREVLYSRSLHYVFNSRIVTKVKWYQTGIFQVFMIIVAIVIAIYNLPAGMAVFLATATTEAILMFILVKVLTYIVISLAVKLFVKLVGAEFALLVVIVAAIAGAYMAVDAGSIAGAPWAQELLQLSSSLSSGVSDAIQADMLDLTKDAHTFGAFAKEQTTLLDQANDLLSGNSLLTPLTIFGEKPDDYYQRTVHSGNIGVLGIDAISSYVNIALTLPKLTDTL